jgi:hypothetical protein
MLDRVDLRYKTTIDRLKMMWRDPSEAPESHKIIGAFRRVCGAELRPLGGVIMHLCAGFLPDGNGDTLQDHLIEADREALAEGHFHFAFALWRKPAAAATA